MYCSQCGVTVSENASFCHKCGKPIASATEESDAPSASAPIDPNLAVTSESVKVLMSEAIPPIKPNAPTRRQVAISIVLAILLALMYWVVVMQALEGTFHTSLKQQSLGGIIFWTALAFWYSWKSLGRTGWIGALIGAIVSILILFGASGISGYVKGQRADILDQVPQFAALKRNFPDVAEQVRRDMRAMSTDKDENREKLAAMIRTKMLPVLGTALKTTSDAAMLQYGKAKIRQFEEIAKANSSDCVAFMSGELAEASPTKVAMIMSGISKETNQAVQDSIVQVINDADAYRNAPPVSDEKRANNLYRQLDAKLQSTHGTSVFYFSDESLKKSPEIRCKAGMLMFTAAINLPEKDRTFMLRTMFAGE